MAGYGVGAGIGTLFRLMGKRKLDDAQMQIYGQQLANQRALQASEITKNNASAALDQNNLDSLQPGAIEQVIRGMGGTPQQAAAFSLMMRGAKGASPDATVKGLASLGAMFAGNAANPQGADAFARALGQDTTKVSDGIAYDPVGASGQQFGITPVGQADIADKHSSIAEHFAQAARARAGIGVDKAGNYAVITDGNGNLMRVNKLTGEATPVMAGAQPVSSKPPAFGSLTPGDMALIAPAQDGQSGYDPTRAQARTYGALTQGGARTAGQVMQWALSHPPVQGAPLPDDGSVPVNYVAPTAAGAAANGLQPASASPYKDGTQLRGPAGKLYVVQNGVPVPAQ